MKKIMKIKTICHGLYHEQEFPGCGVAFTEFDECFTGIGNTAYEAKEDALEQMAGVGYDTEGIVNDEDLYFKCCENDIHIYVSLLIKTN